jgi:tetratricopeptide (TPR) repeat protein
MRPAASSPTPTSPSEETVAWQELKVRIDRLEAERDFKGAIALYYQVRPRADERELVFPRRAQCHLECHETGHAIDFARRAVAVNISSLPARTVLTRALIEHRFHADALIQADGLVAIATYDATAHYLRGKALLGLARLEDARDAFDLALVLRPTMIEAMLLRREADRTLAKLGKSVGQQQTTVVVPESLEPLRDILLGGRIKDVIHALSSPGYATDPQAQLMLARFHTFDRSYGRATALYDRVLESSPQHRHTALVGKATVLLEQGQHESALAMFDALLAEDARDLEACEGRARTLDKLGRVGEAAAAFRRFVSLADAGAKLRVRVAQLWLDQH